MNLFKTIILLTIISTLFVEHVYSNTNEKVLPRNALKKRQATSKAPGGTTIATQSPPAPNTSKAVATTDTSVVAPPNTANPATTSTTPVIPSSSPAVPVTSNVISSNSPLPPPTQVQTTVPVSSSVAPVSSPTTPSSITTIPGLSTTIPGLSTTIPNFSASTSNSSKIASKTGGKTTVPSISTDTQDPTTTPVQTVVVKNGATKTITQFTTTLVTETSTIPGYTSFGTTTGSDGVLTTFQTYIPPSTVLVVKKTVAPVIQDSNSGADSLNSALGYSIFSIFISVLVISTTFIFMIYV